MDGSLFEFDEVEKADMLNCCGSETQRRALNDLALVTEGVSRTMAKESRKTAMEEIELEGPPGLVDSEVSDIEEGPDKEVLPSEEDIEEAADIPLLVLPKE